MSIRTSVLSGSLAVLFAAPSLASLVGSTYDFAAATAGSTQIGATNGTYTDPGNPGFCVGPPVVCGFGSGLSGGFVFTDINPTTATITFLFFGSTAGAGPGTFSIGLGNFALPGGDTITNVTYNSGNLLVGDFSGVSWNGTDATFTGSTNSEFNAIGGTTVVFEVTLEPGEPGEPGAVPEPSSIWLVGPILGGLLVGLKKRRRDAVGGL